MLQNITKIDSRIIAESCDDNKVLCTIIANYNTDKKDAGASFGVENYFSLTKEQQNIVFTDFMMLLDMITKEADSQ